MKRLTDKELQEKYKNVRFNFEAQLLPGTVNSPLVEITCYRDMKQRFLNVETGNIEECDFPVMDSETLREFDAKPQSYWDEIVRLQKLRWADYGK